MGGGLPNLLLAQGGQLFFPLGKTSKDPHPFGFCVPAMKSPKFGGEGCPLFLFGFPPSLAQEGDPGQKIGGAALGSSPSAPQSVYGSSRERRTSSPGLWAWRSPDCLYGRKGGQGFFSLALPFFSPRANRRPGGRTPTNWTRLVPSAKEPLQKKPYLAMFAGCC